ncbi:hypothetical protein QCA50_003356 [Cerrena zonata]|uniref:C3H1-type domain-containing protein n=1 Tax=Cerrena zonata TaxID=2478898 RepID=A0AAW0GRV3_9APHY
MPFVRCMWYNDDGSPIKDGCRKGPNCDFVHPSHLKWDDAPPSRNKPKPSFGFGGPQRTGSNNQEIGSRPSGSWSASRKNTDDAFASDGFSQTGNNGGWNNGDNNAGWGRNNSNSNRNASFSSNSEWPSTDNAGTVAGGGWGSIPTSQGWGVPGPGEGWGSSNPEPSGSGSGTTPSNPEASVWGSVPANAGPSSSLPAATTKPDQSGAWPSAPARPEPSSRSSAPDKAETTGWGSAPSINTGATSGWNSPPAPANTQVSWGSQVTNTSPSRNSPPRVPPPPSEPPQSLPMVVDAPQDGWVSETIDPMEACPAEPKLHSEADVSRMLERFSSARPKSPSAQSDMSSASLDDDESQVKWKTYIRVIARAVRRYERLRELEDKFETSHNVYGSKTYKVIEEGSKAHIMLSKIRRHDDEKRLAAKKRLEETLDELVDLEFPTAGNGLSEEDYMHTQETEKSVREMAEWIESIRPIVEDLRSRNHKEVSSTEDATKPTSAHNAITQLTTRIAKLDAKLDDLEEYFHSAVFDHKEDEYRLMISDKVEEATALVKGSESLDGPAQAVLAAEQQITPVIEKQEDKLKSFNAQLAKMRQDLASRPKLDTVKEEQAKLLQVNEELRQRVIANRKDYSELKAMTDAQSAEIKALRAQLAELQSRPPPPPPPTVEYMTETLMPSILQACHPVVEDIFKQMRDGVQASLNDLQADLIGQVYKGLMPVVGLTDRLQTFVEDENALARANSQPVAGPSNSNAPSTAAPRPASSAPPM